MTPWGSVGRRILKAYSLSLGFDIASFIGLNNL